jgi:hypothetical protein
MEKDERHPLVVFAVGSIRDANTVHLDGALGR